MRVALITVLLVLMTAAPAVAQSGDPVPPGNGAIDQYSDPLADSDGERPLGGAGGRGGGKKGGGGDGGPGGDDQAGPAGHGTGGELGDGSILSADTRAKLAAQGPDGFRVAGLADSTAPRDEAARGDGTEEGSGRGDGSRIAASAEALNGAAPGGMGVWLPVILAAWAVMAVVAAVLTRRRGNTTGS
jgi:hypothetical protein